MVAIGRISWLRALVALCCVLAATLGGVSAERLTIAAWVVLLATYVVDIVLMARCGVAQARVKRAATSMQIGQGQHTPAVVSQADAGVI